MNTIKLIIDNVSDLDLVPVTQRAIPGFQAVRLDHDFTVLNGDPDEFDLEGSKGDYLLVDAAGVPFVVAGEDFADLFQRVVARKAKPAVTEPATVLPEGVNVNA